jgi:hypothetical protein
VSSEQRLTRLRELIDQLERLPPSAERDRMLREVRVRVVDVDTGELTSAMRPVDADPGGAPDRGPRPSRAAKPAAAAPPAPAAPQQRRAAAPTPPPERAPDPLAGAEIIALAAGELLSLDDTEAEPQEHEPRSGRVVGPWTRGLRG